MNKLIKPSVKPSIKPSVKHVRPTFNVLDQSQQQAYNHIMSGYDVFITGPGGSGKSHLIRLLQTRLKCVTTALTGAAAELINGITWHSWAGCSINPITSTELISKIRRNKLILNRWTHTKHLIIDEISMMSAALFNLLWLTKNSLNPSMQLILVGDFCQLPPVKSHRFCFQSRYWKDIITCKLTNNHRQSSDSFAAVLDELRMGIVTDFTKKLLNSRIKDPPIRTDGIVPTYLYPNRHSVDKYNAQKLNELGDHQEIDVSTCKINVKTGHETIKKRSILLAKNAQVMLTCNLVIGNVNLINGSRGVVTGFSAEGFPLVKFVKCDTVLEIKPIRSTIGDVTHQHKTIKNKLPLQLAWALTIHKAQGSTLDLVVTDLRDVFEHGQSYVTLSRVRSLDGLYLNGIKYGKITCHPDVVKFLNR